MDIGYIEPALYAEARNLADSNYRLLNGYIAFLKKRKIGANEPGATVASDHHQRAEPELDDGATSAPPLESPSDRPLTD